MDDELLVNTVRQYQCLYNKRHSLFKDKLAKQNAWQSIANTIGFDGEITAEMCERRFVLLRQKYSAKKKELEKPSGSGREVAAAWPLFESMGFLDAFIQPRRRYGNMPMPSGQAVPLEEQLSISGDVLFLSTSVHDTIEPNEQSSTPTTVLSTSVHDTITQNEQSPTPKILSSPQPPSVHDVEGNVPATRIATGLLRKKGISQRKLTRSDSSSSSSEAVQHCLANLNNLINIHKQGAQNSDKMFSDALSHILNSIRNKRRRKRAKQSMLQLAATFDSSSESSNNDENE